MKNGHYCADDWRCRTFIDIHNKQLCMYTAVQSLDRDPDTAIDGPRGELKDGQIQPHTDELPQSFSAWLHFTCMQLLCVFRPAGSITEAVSTPEPQRPARLTSAASIYLGKVAIARHVCILRSVSCQNCCICFNIG